MVCYWEDFLLKIFIDAGHGGSNPGAVGPNGLNEADVNLDVALRLGRLLSSRNYEVRFSNKRYKCWSSRKSNVSKSMGS